MEWVSVKDRLPKLDATVLVKDEMIGMGVCDFLGKIRKVPVFQSNDHPELWYHHATHWMALPESPKD